MLLFLTIVLIASSLAMFGLLYIKHWELTTGRVLFAGARPHAALLAHHALAAVEHHAPRLLGRAAARSWSFARSHARHGAARTLIVLEHALEAMLAGLRHGLSPARHAGGQASGFLREVAEHKRKLTRVARRRDSAPSGISAPDSDTLQH